MKQPNDTKTADIFAGEKRGRGRPKLDNAKSAAERARQYRLNKKSRPQVARPLAAAADEIGFLRDQVAQLCNDLRETEKALEASEENCDLHLIEISLLRSELDNRDVSQKTPFETSARISALESEKMQLIIERGDSVDVLAARDQLIAELRAQLDKRDASSKIDAQLTMVQVSRMGYEVLISPELDSATITKGKVMYVATQFPLEGWARVSDARLREVAGGEHADGGGAAAGHGGTTGGRAVVILDEDGYGVLGKKTGRSAVAK